MANLENNLEHTPKIDTSELEAEANLKPEEFDGLTEEEVGDLYRLYHSILDAHEVHVNSIPPPEVRKILREEIREKIKSFRK
ncbi:hypothetical protein KW782_01710 [Candidatus Parcubacteria bacterium]|nr:hypothetical protein [Candidatus Parcubacteria bacterium]